MKRLDTAQCSVGFALLNKRANNPKLFKSFSPGPPLTIMFSISVLVFMFPLALTFASPLQDAGDQTIQLSSVDFRSPANLSDNETAIRLNVSNEIRIQCDGEKYGFNPDVADCQNARSYYKRSSTPFTYGERHSGHGINVFPLPYRLMGGMLSESSNFFTRFSPRNGRAKTHGR